MVFILSYRNTFTTNTNVRVIEMNTIVNLYSSKQGEIKRFLETYKKETMHIPKNKLKWEKVYKNPIEISDIIGIFIENNDRYRITMWISLDEGIFINVTENNADEIIRYLFERYPY